MGADGDVWVSDGVRVYPGVGVAEGGLDGLGESAAVGEGGDGTCRGPGLAGLQGGIRLLGADTVGRRERLPRGLEAGIAAVR